MDFICISESGFIFFDPFTRDTITFDLLRTRNYHIDPKSTYMVLEGGEDISPYLYGEGVRFARASSKPSRRDIYNYEMIKFAQRYKIPVIGICRGHQIINAYCGGSLHQDIYYDLGVLHIKPSHIVYLNIDDIVYEKTVNSIHHQAVKKIPKGAILTAIAEDNIIEGTYYPSSLFGTAMYGVQWHPEMMHDDELIQMILNILYRDLHGINIFTVNPKRMQKLFSVEKNTPWVNSLIKYGFLSEEKENGVGKF